MSAFDRVLIANRGEIAVRLIRACRELELATVAVYSDPDAGAPHVSLADEAVALGGSAARDSYLYADKLIAAARRTGAGAIHPGYGFLAENADFARACADAGIVFVGPSPEAIAAMGAKIQAKRIAREAGVACVPGYDGDDQSDERLRTEAQSIGTPLLIKASAGGGGRGMRRVDDLAQLDEALALARAEAQAAFGDPALLLERYIAAPRHIEVQILADRHGHVRHLYERDCSVQRNYQKVIEEAPAPNLDPELRAQMLEQAVVLATAIGYDSAGTVEFIVDDEKKEAFFLEMNTRLQVEHPVTEMITGIDLAAWQLRIAAGAVIDFGQDAVRCTGWAMEARIAAEDPAQNYAPCTGTISDYAPPGGPGLRLDSGVFQGSVVSPHYDSMLAKLIAHGSDRDQARRRLRRGLADLQLAGIDHNLSFLRDALALGPFVQGRHLTSLLAQTWPEGWQPAELGARDQALAAVARQLAAEAATGPGPWQSLGAWRLGESSGRPARACWLIDTSDGATREATVIGCGGDYRVQLDGEYTLEVQDARLQGGDLHYAEGGHRRRLRLRTQGESVQFIESGESLVLHRPQARLLAEEAGAVDAAHAILAPTPGQISEVLVAPGDAVETGQPVLVLEAMKMLQQLCAGRDGVIARIAVAAGDAVNSGDLLVALEENAE